MESEILFKETQKFTQWWLWVLLLLPVFIFMFQLIEPIFLSDANNSGNLSLSIILPSGIWYGIMGYLLVLLFFLFSKLETKITADQIQLKHLIFVKKSFRWKDIEAAELIRYGFVGYGIRLSIKYGTVYNVKDNKGLRITLKNGKKYLVGTQKPEELEVVVKKLVG
ncbi:MAG: hypothetical protein WBB24_10495 [Maribacter sp.]